MPRITKRTVDALKPGPKDTDYWDDQLPGFGLRVKPSGMKSYVIRYRTRTGGQRRVTLGQHGKLTPEQARQMAQDLFAEIRKGQGCRSHFRTVLMSRPNSRAIALRLTPLARRARTAPQTLSSIKHSAGAPPGASARIS